LHQRFIFLCVIHLCARMC